MSVHLCHVCLSSNIGELWYIISPWRVTRRTIQDTPSAILYHPTGIYNSFNQNCTRDYIIIVRLPKAVNLSLMIVYMLEPPYEQYANLFTSHWNISNNKIRSTSNLSACHLLQKCCFLAGCLRGCTCYQIIYLGAPYWLTSVSTSYQHFTSYSMCSTHWIIYCREPPWPRGSVFGLEFPVSGWQGYMFISPSFRGSPDTVLSWMGTKGA